MHQQESTLAHMRSQVMTRRRAIGGIAGGGLVLAASMGVPAATEVARARNLAQATPMATPGGAAPTVVLVHGAWADSTGWSEVITALEASGIPVVAIANPLRSLSGDSDYVASAVGQIPGSVLLVGHSYGGAVITNAALQAANVAGLVYVSAFIPDEGETLLALAGQATDSLLSPALRPASYPVASGAGPGTEFVIDRASFHAVFCADLPEAQATVMAVAQRPAADLAFGEPTTNPAWKQLPSWAVVSTADKAIGVTGLRLMAQRAGATVTEVDASHAVMLSQPATVTDVIRAALAQIG